MLQFKDTDIFKNLSLFNNDETNSIVSFLKFLKSANLEKLFNTPGQSKYSRGYSFVSIALYYFLGLGNVNQFYNSSWARLISNGKDVFYRFSSNPDINWRTVMTKLNHKLLRTNSIADQGSNSPTCFIIDDSDIPKRGRKIEFIGRVWSHVFNKSILGFKSLNLCLWNGRSLFAIDFSFHFELGKNNAKVQGMKPTHIKQRYTKHRPANCYGTQRVNELAKSKIEMSISMLKTAIKNGLSARYVLVDSWFCCEKMIKYVYSLSKTDLICRAKMGTAKYFYANKNLTTKALLAKFKYRKDVRKYSRKLKANYILLKVDFKEIPIKLLFLQTGRDKWIVLLTTDRKASVTKIIETYQIRWSIEIFFKECKQHLGLGKCQANDFDAQIANTTIALIRYNWLSKIKSESQNYGVGTLFRKISQSINSPTIVDQIIKLFYKMQSILTQILEIDVEQVLERILNHPNLSEFDYRLMKLFASIDTCET